MTEEIKPPDGPLVWFDLEATGVPETGTVHRIHVIVTDASLTEMAEQVLEVADVGQADETLASFLAASAKPGEALLAGSEIHFKKRYLQAHFLKVNAHLHYRLVDLTTLRQLVSYWQGESSLFPRDIKNGFAAVRQDIDELRFYRDRSMKPGIESAISQC